MQCLSGVKKRLEICLEEIVDFLMSRKGESYYLVDLLVLLLWSSNQNGLGKKQP